MLKWRNVCWNDVMCVAGPGREDGQAAEADEPALPGPGEAQEPRGGGLQDGHQKPPHQAQRRGEAAVQGRLSF